MFARCAPRQVARRAVRTIRSSHQVPLKRRYSNSSVAPPADAPSPAAALGGLTSELDRLSPRFDIPASQIQIIQSPSEFYETLKASLGFQVHFSSLSGLSEKNIRSFIIFPERQELDLKREIGVLLTMLIKEPVKNQDGRKKDISFNFVYR